METTLIFPYIYTASSGLFSIYSDLEHLDIGTRAVLQIAADAQKNVLINQGFTAAPNAAHVSLDFFISYARLKVFGCYEGVLANKDNIAIFPDYPEIPGSKSHKRIFSCFCRRSYYSG